MGEQEPVIRVDSLGKRYVIDHAPDRGRSETLRDAVSGGLRSLGRRLLGRTADRNSAREEFWALRNVSFEVKPGEVVGIIGRNGAGKSTLLKILSRITEPTTGQVEIDGRVASLLEVGTGFHGELTGRENIYLNGSILGMSRAEIRKKFDEIVAFAEVEKFLDTPVKRYSSGMYMRLAFAVAAHLEPEILIVDEVLAVGDSQFQKKSLGKMGAVARSGRTVLFVSHNFEAVQTLCTRAVLLDDGHLVMDTDPASCIRSAIERMAVTGQAGSFTLDLRRQGAVPRPTAMMVEAAATPDNAGPRYTINFDEAVVCQVELDGPIHPGQTFAFQVLTPAGVHIFNSFYADDPTNPPLIPGVTRRLRVTVPGRFLPAGQYEAVVAMITPAADIFWLTRGTWFTVSEERSYRNVGLTTSRTGLVAVILRWDAE